MTDLPTSRIDLKAVLSGSSPTAAKDDHSEGMSYLQSLPRRLVTLYLPLSIIVIILLFPFYWMALTSVKPDEQLLDLDKFNPFWTLSPTFKHFHKLLFESYYPHWLWNTMYVAVCATVLSIISWSLKHLGLITQNINFLGDTTWARICVIFANIWRGVPFVAITLLAGLQTVQPSLYEAATLDGATRWQMFRHITYPLLTPIIAVVMTFSVLFTFTDFQLIWAMTRGGPVNATHLMATLSYQRAIIAGQLGEGAAISSAMIPFLLAAIMVSWFGLQRRKWQQGENND